MFPVELFVDASSGRLSKLQTYQNDHIWGDVLTEATYGDWAAPEGNRVMFPYQVELAVAGNTLRTASRTNVVINPEFPTVGYQKTLSTLIESWIDRASLIGGDFQLG